MWACGIGARAAWHPYLAASGAAWAVMKPSRPVPPPCPLSAVYNCSGLVAAFDDISSAMQDATKPGSATVKLDCSGNFTDCATPATLAFTNTAATGPALTINVVGAKKNKGNCNEIGPLIGTDAGFTGATHFFYIDQSDVSRPPRAGRCQGARRAPARPHCARILARAAGSAPATKAGLPLNTTAAQHLPAAFADPIDGPDPQDVKLPVLRGKHLRFLAHGRQRHREGQELY